MLRSYNWNFAVKRLALVGTWVTGTVYTTDQYVWTNSLLYKCAIAHTAGTFATDLAAVKWTLITARPSFGYDYQYSLPSDCLRFVKTDYDEDEYDVEGKLVVTDEQTLNVEYVYQVTDTTIWDTLFYECFILKLAINLLHPLAGTNVGQMRQMLESELKEIMTKARLVSSSESKNTGSSTWNDARYS
jgi:hypothetical protein